jgi:hypothetical protein
MAPDTYSMVPNNESWKDVTKIEVPDANLNSYEYLLDVFNHRACRRTEPIIIIPL